jgi:hypothetical protein
MCFGKKGFQHPYLQILDITTKRDEKEGWCVEVRKN